MYKPPLADPEDQQISDGGIIEFTQNEVAEYICNMCYELAVMAKKANMPMLWYLLKLASAEANTNRRDADAMSH